jgi:hypothetical protein
MEFSSCWGYVLISVSGVSNLEKAKQLGDLHSLFDTFLDGIFAIGNAMSVPTTSLLALRHDGKRVAAFWDAPTAHAEYHRILEASNQSPEIDVVHMIGAPLHQPLVASIVVSSSGNAGLPAESANNVEQFPHRSRNRLSLSVNC